MLGSGRQASLLLADGRALEYWDGGDPTGRAVLMQPGTPATRLLGCWGHEAALAAGLRLVAVNRPGYGGSTTPPTTEPPSLLATGRDTAALAAALGLDGYAVLGISGGGPFAVASAVADPGRVRALALVSGVGPWRDLDPPSDQDRDDRRYLARLDAGDVAGAWAGFRRVAERDIASLADLDEESRVDEMLGGDDSPLVHDAGYRAIWAANIAVLLQNTDGYVRDNLAWGGTWDVDPADVVAPTLVWDGNREGSAAPPYARWFADRISGAQLTVFAGEGHLDVCDGHWPELMTKLASA